MARTPRSDPTAALLLIGGLIVIVIPGLILGDGPLFATAVVIGFGSIVVGGFLALRDAARQHRLGPPDGEGVDRWPRSARAAILAILGAIVALTLLPGEPRRGQRRSSRSASSATS